MLSSLPSGRAFSTKPIADQSGIGGDAQGPRPPGRSQCASGRLKVTFNPYMFEDCADETWQLERFPTSKEQARLGSQMDATDLKNNLPIRASSEDEGDFGVTWLEPRPTSDRTSWQSKQDDDAGLPAAARLHSCEYCPWGYFGNEGSEIDLYTYAALHIKIPPFGRGLRGATKALKRTAVKRVRSTRKRKQ